jgi:Tfp pilus assembly protein PilX
MNAPFPITPVSRRLRSGGPRRQQGLVLFIALIVLVAMSLAGVALMRSVDTGTVVAGNMAFKQSAINVADRGTQEAAAWITANSAGATLYNDNLSVGYFSSQPPAEPDWFDIANWGDGVVLNGGTPDAAGNVVRYMIHRMCVTGNESYAGTNDCALYYPTSVATSGGSMAVGATQFIGNPQLYYRITTRVDGPRNTVSVIQTSVLVGT